MRNGRIFICLYPTNMIRINGYYIVNNHPNFLSMIVINFILVLFILVGIRKSPYCVRLLARTVVNQNEEELK